MANRFIAPFFDAGSGITPEDGAKLFFFDTGTSNPRNTFTDKASSTPNANPVIANSNGVFPDIFTDGDYKVRLTDKNDVQIWEADPVNAVATDNEVVKNFPTLALAISNINLVDGDVLNIAERTAGNGGGAFWDVVLSSTVTENTFNIVQATGVATLSLVLRVSEGVAYLDQFGADLTGATTVSAIAQAANDALPNTGGIIYAPSGSYLLDVFDGLLMDGNVTLQGEGDASLFVFGATNAISAVSKTNIELRDIKVQNENGRVFFDLCDNVRLINCSAQGLRTVGGDLTQQGFWFAGCTDVLIENPNLDNFNNAIYLAASGSTPCGVVHVNGGLIEQTDGDHGTTISTPTGVYGFEVEYLYVDNVLFKNIKPSLLDSAPIAGYGVYEGDGTDGNLKVCKVNNCSFIDDDGFTSSRPMVGVLMSVAEEGIVDGCDFTGVEATPFKAFDSTCRDQTIQNCTMNGSHITVSRTTGVTGYKSLKVHNNTFKNIANQPLIVQNADGSNILEYASITDNTFKNATFGAMWIRFCDYAHVTGNTIIDCNTSGDANDFFRGGINFFGTIKGFVDGNTVMNVADGLMDYAVTSNATANEIVVTSNNKFRGMVIGAFLRGPTSAPTTGTWDVGSTLHFWAAAAGSVPGIQCTTTGTSGTLNGGSTTGGITSGTTALVVSVNTGLSIRDKISIAGVTGTKTVVAISGTAVTIDSNADATVSTAAVAFVGPLWKNMANLSV